MDERLPPLNALRAFESVARLLSIKEAANELYVTPAAVSQQIKSLESYLDVQLFERKTRALVLTEAGEHLYPFIEEGFSKLEEGVRQLRRRRQSNELVVSAAPSFAAKWLIPRLGNFHRAYPSYRLRVDASESLANFRTDGVDVALRYGTGEYPGVFCQELIPEEMVPVCSPALLEGDFPLKTPDDLRHHMLLRTTWQTGQESAPRWEMWLIAAGLTDIDPDAGYQFSSEFMAVQAAIEGQGVALTEKSLVAQDIEAGRLVYPFGEGFNQMLAFSYYFVCPESHLRLDKVQAFKAWIEQELKTERSS